MSTGFTFGAKTTAAPAFGTGSIIFGTPATQNQTTFGFGAPANVQPTTGGYQFGTSTSAPVSNLFGTSGNNLNFKSGAFGAPAQTTGLFGTPATAPTGGLSFGSASNTGLGFASGPFSTPAVSTNPALSFGAPTLSTSGLPFNTTTTSVSTGGTANPFGTTGFSFGTSNSVTPALGTSVASRTAGGLASSQTKTGAVVTIQKEIPPKEQPLPNEILQTVEQFKEMVKLQKLHSSDIARCSVRDFRRVEQEIDLLNNLLNDVEYQLQKNRHLAEKLKYDTAKCLQNVEMAQRTQDTPPGLQYENTAPLRYFLELANQFEREMQSLKIQIESADKYVKNHRNPDTLTPQDLALGMRRLHETFVALAGRLQSVHSQVESQKETYLNVHRHIFNDSSNPFEKLSKPVELNVSSLRNALIYSPPKVSTGPTPFNKLAIGNGTLLLQHQNQSTSPYPGNSTGGASSGFGNTSFGSQIGNQASTTSLFGNAPFGQTSFGNVSTNFQLQKPPTGNKRGKQ
ncbi:hypothetical protein NQ314_020417 [Rhamnusium bicolor]|uniref:Nucleoporin p58/p45 n=1 Tax=Rhamnusium bicolor TaxID=1586634 RepID=A0AAV8WK66_9CUCU|nr:hypothetical protein NQ314_020417 [Rhamnusium bicolor]